MEKHTKAILDLAQQLFSAYKERFEEFKIGTEKSKLPITSQIKDI
jgi:hypothetical protein